MAAISASRSMAIPAIEPERRARAVATIDNSPAALDAVARMAARERATVVISTAATPSGRAIATALAARLDREKIENHRSLAVGAESYRRSRLGRRSQEDGGRRIGHRDADSGGVREADGSS